MNRDHATKNLGLPITAVLDGDGSAPVRRLEPTAHALRTILAKGFDPADVRAVFERPDRATEVRKNPGQVRLLGRGLALVGEWTDVYGEWIFTLITVYADGVLTPPRPDQLRTEEGREYAARYAAGLGRTPVSR